MRWPACICVATKNIHFRDRYCIIKFAKVKWRQTNHWGSCKMIVTTQIIMQRRTPNDSQTHTTDLAELLLKCAAQSDPMLCMLEWLCIQLMEAEVDQQLDAKKSSAYRRQKRFPQRLSSVWIPGWQPRP